MTENVPAGLEYANISTLKYFDDDEEKGYNPSESDKKNKLVWEIPNVKRDAFINVTFKFAHHDDLEEKKKAIMSNWVSVEAYIQTGDEKKLITSKTNTSLRFVDI